MGCWCLDSKWLHNDRVQELLKDSDTQYWEVNESSASLQMVWGAFKAFIRGQYISAIKSARVEYNSQLTLLQQAESEAASEFVSSPTGDNYSTLAQACRELEFHLTSLTHAEAALQAGRLFESGDKNGKLLANLVGDSRHLTVVSELLSDAGGLFYRPF